MDALVSGKIGVAAILADNLAELIWADGRSEKIPIGSAYNICRVADDVVFLESSTKTNVLECLKIQYEKDRALTLFLIMLDSSTPPEDRMEVAETLSGWFENDETANYVKYVMYSRPLPSHGIISKDGVDSVPSIGKIITRLIGDQVKIRHIRNNWDNISRSLSSKDKESYEINFIRNGVFYRLTSSSKKELEELKFECLLNLSTLIRYRELISELIDPFIEVCDVIQGQSATQYPILNSEEIEQYQELVIPIKTPHQSYEHAQQRLDIASVHFQEGEIDKAKKVIDWLSDEQKSNGDFDYAAKTLCNASEMAKKVKLFDLQLEYAKSAHDVSPDDARVFGHIGDAYLNLDDLGEAEYWFSRSINSEHGEYALSSMARVRRRQNKLEEALELVCNALDKYEGDPETWLQRAEILRDLRRYDEAISAYSEARDRYPYNDSLLCGLAATYADAGFYSNALETYDRAIALFQDSGVAYTGKGHLLARLGRLDEALPYLNKGIDNVFDKTIAVNALASALLMHGKGMRALHLLQKAIEGYPESVDTWITLIDGAIRCGKYNEARTWIKNSLYKTGQSPGIRLQEVKLLAATGGYSQAMEYLESIIIDRPGFTEALVEKSRLLRKVNKFEEARSEIQSLITNNRISKLIDFEGTMLGLLEIPKDVVSNRAGLRSMATLEDWDYDYACSIALLGERDAKSAWRISLDGRKRSPFKYLKKRFRLILAVARDYLGRTGSVINALKGYGGLDGLVIKAIVLWKLGLSDRLSKCIMVIQRERKKDSSENRYIAELYELTASKYDPENDDIKVMDLESNILLQAA